MGVRIETLEAALHGWTDWDSAGYVLGVALGLIDPERVPFATKAKHVGVGGSEPTFDSVPSRSSCCMRSPLNSRIVTNWSHR